MTETYQPPTTHVIPAKAGIYLAASKLSKRQHSSGRRQKSTQYDRVRRTATKTRACACTHARGNGVPSPFSRHRLRPGRPGLDVSLGVAAPQAWCQYIKRNQRSNGLR